MPVSSKKTAIIHLAKKELGLTDAAYRAILYAAAEIETAADITTEAQFNTIMQAFKRLGFGGKKSPRATIRQKMAITSLWLSVSREKSDRSLKSFLNRLTGATSVHDLSKKQASTTIVALKKKEIQK